MSAGHSSEEPVACAESAPGRLRPADQDIVAGAERRLAVEHWLLSATDDPGRTRQEWRKAGVALLRCGGILAAVRINAPIVTGAAGTTDQDEVDAYLAEALCGGPVFMDTVQLRYYALVPPSTRRSAEWGRLPPGDDIEFIGRGWFLGVPAVTPAPLAGHRSYWCVGMDSPAVLCPPEAVVRLVERGRSETARETSHAAEAPQALSQHP